MKITNNFAIFKGNYVKQNDSNNDYRIRFADAHRILNDSLMQDSIAINLAREIASAKAGKTHINVEEFVKNVLDTFTYTVKACSFRKQLEQVGEQDGQNFYIQMPETDVFVSSKKSEFDKRVEKLKEYQKVDLKSVSPEVLKAFRELDPEVLKLLPDGILSTVLLKCSDTDPVFLNSEMKLNKKMQIIQKMRDVSTDKEDWNKHDDLLQKLLLSSDVSKNLSTITSLFDMDDLKGIFEKNEKDRYAHKRALAAFQHWLLSSASGGNYHELLFELRNAKSILY